MWSRVQISRIWTYQLQSRCLFFLEFLYPFMYDLHKKETNYAWYWTWVAALFSRKLALEFFRFTIINFKLNCIFRFWKNEAVIIHIFYSICIFRVFYMWIYKIYLPQISDLLQQTWHPYWRNTLQSWEDQCLESFTLKHKVRESWTNKKAECTAGIHFNF